MTVTASGYEQKKNNLYETPLNVTEILMRHLPVAGLIVWEPCAGNHKIADMLTLCGATVVTTDIERYDRDHSNGLLDFTDPLIDEPDGIKIHHVCDSIITNPPYGPQGRLAATFCRLALKRCDGWIAMLMNNNFDSGSTRMDLFRDNPRWFKKLVLLDRPAWFGDGGGTVDYSWFIWGPGAYSSATITYERLIK